MARISYVDPATITDPEIQAILEASRREGTPRPEMMAIGAHDPESMKLYQRLWRHLFKGGRLEHDLKELLRVHVAQLIDCHY